jgi:hypothetical protein
MHRRLITAGLVFTLLPLAAGPGFPNQDFGPH